MLVDIQRSTSSSNISSNLNVFSVRLTTHDEGIQEPMLVVRNMLSTDTTLIKFRRDRGGSVSKGMGNQEGQRNINSGTLGAVRTLNT